MSLVYRNPLEGKTKLKEGALNYRVDQSVAKYMGFRDVERGSFLEKANVTAKGEYQPKRKKTPTPLDSFSCTKCGLFLACSGA